VIRLIALDLDGTLLGPNFRVGEADGRGAPAPVRRHHCGHMKTKSPCFSKIVRTSPVVVSRMAMMGCKDVE